MNYVAVEAVILSSSSCLHGDGSTRRNFLYVSDITSAYDVLLHHGVPGEVYNIGTDFEISMKDLANVLIKKVMVALADCSHRE